MPRLTQEQVSGLQDNLHDLSGAYLLTRNSIGCDHPLHDRLVAAALPHLKVVLNTQISSGDPEAVRTVTNSARALNGVLNELTPELESARGLRSKKTALAFHNMTLRLSELAMTPEAIDEATIQPTDINRLLAYFEGFESRDKFDRPIRVRLDLPRKDTAERSLMSRVQASPDRLFRIISNMVSDTTGHTNWPNAKAGAPLDMVIRLHARGKNVYADFIGLNARRLNPEMRRRIGSETFTTTVDGESVVHGHGKVSARQEMRRIGGDMLPCNVRYENGRHPCLRLKFPAIE